MEFFGPEAADFANVRALNRAFLLRLRAPGRGKRLRRSMPHTVQALVKGLTDLQVERLATAPFLLLSLRERDEKYWRIFTADEPDFDLFTTRDGDADALGPAALSFLWHLAQRNPYAARLLSGATLQWCEQLANCTLVTLLQRSASRGDLLQPRLAADSEFWRRSLGPGLSSDLKVRHAAHVTALQSLLTDDPVVNYRRLKSAACRNAAPSMSIADIPRRR